MESPDGSFILSGKVNISEIRERLGIEIEPEGFETVGGYVLTRVDACLLSASDSNWTA